MVGAAMDELAPGETDAAMGEWTIAVVLGSGSTWTGVIPGPEAPCPPHRRPVLLTGWGIAPPHRLAEAIDRALQMEGSSEGAPEATFEDASYASATGASTWATPAALAFCDAVTSLRRGHPRRALVTSDSGAGVSLAAILHN